MRIGVAPLAALAVSLTAYQSAWAFILPGWNVPRSRSSSLHAKASKRKKKAPTAAAAGGFGNKSTGSAVGNKKEDDDYAAFPALEKEVKETILPVQGDVSLEGTELPKEVYDRLAQIYGFSQFNYEQQDDEEDTVSLGDMLSSSQTSELGNKQTAAIDFADLLATATGGEVAESALPFQNMDASTDWSCLSRLPPFPDFRVLHVDPLVLAVEDFFTDEECDRYVKMSEAPSSKNGPQMTRSKTVGKDALAKAQRTSTTWFHHYKEVPELMAKASRLLGLESIDHWEEPQTVRYRRNEKFTWHLDALAPADNLQSLGGQRTATLLVYLTDLMDTDGGATMFRDLSDSNGTLRVRPKKGSALLFFPAAGGIPNVPFDIRTLHCGEVVSKDASQDKWIAQLWLRKGTYEATAPPGNTHSAAIDAISNYCTAHD